MDDLLTNVSHCQKKILKYSETDDIGKLLYYLNKLKNLPIKVLHLEQTGVGRSVNSLRNHEGQVGERARALVDAWKERVTAEETNRGPVTAAAAHSTAEDTAAMSAEVPTPPMTSPRPSKQQPPTLATPPQQSPEDLDDDEDCERLQIEEAQSGDEASTAEEDPNSYDPSSSSHDYKIQTNGGGGDAASLKFSAMASTVQKYGLPASCSDSDHSPKYNPLTSAEDYESLNANLDEPVVEYKPTSIGGGCDDEGSEQSGEEIEMYEQDQLQTDYKNKYKHKSKDKKHKAHSKKKESKDKHRHKSSDKDKERSHRYKRKDKDRTPSKNEEHIDGDVALDRRRSKGNKNKDNNNDTELVDSSFSPGQSPDIGDDIPVNGHDALPDSVQDKTSSPNKRKSHDNHSSSSSSVGSKTKEDKHRHDKKDKKREREKQSDKSTSDHKSKKRKGDCDVGFDAALMSVDSSDTGKRKKSKTHNKPKEEKSNKSSKSSSKDEHNTSNSNDQSSKSSSKDEHSKSNSKDQSSKSNSKDERSKSNSKDQSSKSNSKDERSKSNSKDERSKSNSKDQSSKSNSKDQSSKSNSKDQSSKSNSKDQHSKSNSSSSHKREVSNEASTSRSVVVSPDNPDAGDASSDLPQIDAVSKINPNYKPLPRIPLPDVLDDDLSVYPSFLPSFVPLSEANLTEEETLKRMMSSKGKGKRQIYSGKASSLSEVPSLFDLSVRCLQENIDALEYTGGIPFSVLKPVIERTTASQLFNLEKFNPYLLEDTFKLWEQHCKKDFKNKQPDDMETYRDLYMRLTDERNQKLKSLTENLKGKFVTKPAPRRTTQLAFVGTVAKPPASVARAQAKYGTGLPVGSQAKTTKAAEVQARKQAMHNAQRVEKTTGSSGPSSVARSSSAAAKKPKAPLMVKTMQFYKKTFRR